MEIKELAWNETSSKRFNNPLFPRNIRGLIVGKSNCGKTTLLLNFLLRPEWLDYDNLIVFGKSLFQPEYRILKKALEEQLSKEAIIRLFDNQNEIMRLNLSPVNLLEEMAKYQTDKSTINCKFFESTTDVPDPRELNLNKKNLIVFDDLLLEKQNKCEAYYTRGRHSNVDCFYLAQNYFRLPRQTIRENANFICLFPQDLKNISHIYNDHASSDMDKEQFKNLCKTAWDKPHSFVVVDLSSDKNNGKYRIGLDVFYIPK